jgi:AcrR family transcriptional regulator
MNGVTTMTTPGTEHGGGKGGRGARERILRAANELFYEQGINSTGIEQLAEAAHVSKRTLYQHFASKDELIVEYLRRINSQRLPDLIDLLADTGLTARERLLGVYDTGGDGGCPFVNATAELPDVTHPGRAVCEENKSAFIATLISLAAEAGARTPDALGRHLALLYDGAMAQRRTLNSDEPRRQARAAAAALIDLATA